MTPEQKAQRTLELVNKLLALHKEDRIYHTEESWTCGDPDCCGSPYVSTEYTAEAEAIFTELHTLYPKE